MQGTTKLKRLRNILILTTGLLIIGIIAIGVYIQISAPGVKTTFSVAPVFKDFYQQVGGEDRLGPAISPLFEQDRAQYQYTIGGLMMYDPLGDALQPYRMASIASEWNIQSPEEGAPANRSLPYLNGHVIWEEIWPYYSQFGSAIFGLPLTGVQLNPEKQRYEQYFEGVGFYRNVNDKPGDFSLMPYGDWLCASDCPYTIQDAIPTAVVQEEGEEVTQLFLDVAERLGYEFTGPRVNGPYQAEDGYYEMVFMNVVIYLDPENPIPARLRPLPAWLGVIPDPPVPESSAAGMYFYPVQGDLGYNVPDYFIDYITRHGTMEISGPPITELHPKEEGVSSQCFSNLCLEYHANGPEELRIRTSAMGSQYFEKAAAEQTAASSATGVIDIQVWERYPLLPSGQAQEIGVAILEDGVPLPGVEFDLTVTWPDGTAQPYYIPPTGENGQTTVQLDTVDGANGAVVPYKVCIIGLVIPPICVSESFIIWGSQ